MGTLTWVEPRKPSEDELSKSISFETAARNATNQEFGSQEVLDALREDMKEHIEKAMAINSIAGGGGYGNYDALRLEDLDSMMSSVLFKKEHFVLQRWLERVPALQIIHQYNVKKRYSTGRGRGFFIEGGGPGGSTAAYERKTAQVRFLGVEGGITQQTTMLKPGGIQANPVDEENENRTMELLERLERAILHADSAMIDASGNVLEYDGLIKQIAANSPARNIIDMRGQPLDLRRLDEIALLMFGTYYTTDFSKFSLFCPPQVLTDLSLMLRVDPTTGAIIQRLQLPNGASTNGGIDPGVKFNGYTTQYGRIPFSPSVFMDPVDGNTPVTDSTKAAGSAPTIASATAAADATSLMENGTYYYFAAAIYDNGESLPSAGTSVAVSAGQKVTVTVNRPGATDRLRGYNLYRGTTSVAADARWVSTIGGVDQATSAWVDLNQQIPGASSAVLLEGHTENLELAQLAPMFRFPLPVVKTLMPFYYLMYHVPIVKIPERQFLIKNIGRLPQ